MSLGPLPGGGGCPVARGPAQALTLASAVCATSRIFFTQSCSSSCESAATSRDQCATEAMLMEKTNSRLFLPSGRMAGGRKERRAGDTGLSPRPTPGAGGAHSLPLQDGGRAARRQAPDPISKSVSAKDQPARTVDLARQCHCPWCVHRASTQASELGGGGPEGYRGVQEWGELRTRAACGGPTLSFLAPSMQRTTRDSPSLRARRRAAGSPI